MKYLLLLILSILTLVYTEAQDFDRDLLKKNHITQISQYSIPGVYGEKDIRNIYYVDSLGLVFKHEMYLGEKITNIVLIDHDNSGRIIKELFITKEDTTVTEYIYNGQDSTYKILTSKDWKKQMYIDTTLTVIFNEKDSEIYLFYTNGRLHQKSVTRYESNKWKGTTIWGPEKKRTSSSGEKFYNEKNQMIKMISVSTERGKKTTETDFLEYNEMGLVKKKCSNYSSHCQLIEYK